MTETLFKEVHYSLGGLINDIGLGRIGLPDIQRPFVWANAKVRDLFDSMYRDYPVGYFLFWQTGAEGVETKVIGDANKQKAPSLLIVDGQQRLTSLYAVIRQEAVLRENFEREHFRIAFRPQTGTFAVPDATTERDPEYIPDLSEVFNRPTHGTVGEYLKRLTAARDVSDAEEEKVADAIGRLAGLTNYPFIALELSQQFTEEQVADVFVRINSEGKKLNQSDFILTLMSVFWDYGRAELEMFCRAARQPAPVGQASPFKEWDDNIAISDVSPAKYWPKYAERFSSDELAQMRKWHALPDEWWALSYVEFLAARSPLMADIVRAGYAKLAGATT